MARHTAVLLLSVIFAIVGCGHRGAPGADGKAAYPRTINVTVRQRAASATVMDRTVTAAVEHALAGVAGVEHLVSRTWTETSTVTLYLRGDAQVEKVMQDVRTALAALQPRLPAEADVPTLDRIDPARLPDMWLVLHSDSFSVRELSELAPDLRRQVLAVPHVAQIHVHGAGQSFVEIRVDAERLAAYGLDAVDVLRALRQELALTIPGPLKPGRPSDFAELVITRHNDVPVMLRDVAVVEVGFDGSHGAAHFRGQPVVAFGLYFSDSATPRATATSVGQLVSDLRTTLPETANLTLLTYGPPGVGHGEPQNGRQQADHEANRSRVVLVELAFPGGHSQEEKQRVVVKIADAIQDSQGVADVLTVVTDRSQADVDYARLFVRLAGPEDPSAAAEEDIRKRLAEIPGVRARTARLPAATLPRYPQWPIHLLLLGDEHDAVAGWSDEVANRLVSAGFTDVFSDGPTASPEIQIVPDRSRMSHLGVSTSRLTDLLSLVEGQARVGWIVDGNERWAVRLNVGPIGEWNVDDLLGLAIKTDGGGSVPLQILATAELRSAPSVIQRYDLSPMATITASPGKGMTLQEASSLAGELVQKVHADMGLPPDYRLIDANAARR
jgi:multidrug efflux pump subunit AcrB